MRLWGVIGSAGLALGGAGCVLPTPAGGRTPADTAPITSGELPATAAAALDLKMAEQLERDGKDVEAIAYYERARELAPNLHDRAARRLAILYDRQDQQARAMIEFQALLKKHPKDATLLNDLGYSYYNRGQWTEAEVYLRRAVAADKTNLRAWTNLGMTLAQLGKYSESLESFSKSVSPAEAHANLGFVLASQKKKAEAEEQYKQALAIEPRLPVALSATDKLENPAASPRPDDAAPAQEVTNPAPTNAAPPETPLPSRSAAAPTSPPRAVPPTETPTAAPASPPAVPPKELPTPVTPTEASTPVPPADTPPLRQIIPGPIPPEDPPPPDSKFPADQ